MACARWKSRISKRVQRSKRQLRNGVTRMRRTCLGAALQKRLSKLETAAVAGPLRIRVRLGRLRRLPKDYAGEKHVIVAKELPTENGREWVEFGEVPGPDTNPPAF